MKLNLILAFLFLVSLLLGACSKETFIDDGEGIQIEFVEGLNDDVQFQLSKDINGYYSLTLNRHKNQTIQRITAKLTRNNFPVEDLNSGSSEKKVFWYSNLYWWLLEGDTVAQITETYINYFTGELVYVNLPPIINWEDMLVPTINSASYTDAETGVVNTVIAPVIEMLGDTMKVVVSFNHNITSQEEGSTSYSVIGERVLKDSTYIILK